MWVKLLSLFSFFRNREKRSTQSGLSFIFIGIIAIFLLFLFFSNLDPILSRFGFETTSKLKEELTRTQGQLQQLTLINESLNKNIELLKAQYEEQVRVLEEYRKRTEEAEKKVEETQKKYQVALSKLNKKIESATKVDNDVIIIPIKDINEASMSNISAINNVYNNLFSLKGDKK